jgi:hypothetical protein
MRGDQLARQWWAIRTIEASPNELAITAPAQREKTRMRTINRVLETSQAAGFPLYTEKVHRSKSGAFVKTFKQKIPPPFTQTDLVFLYYCEDILVRFLIGSRFYDSLDSAFRNVQSTLAPEATIQSKDSGRHAPGAWA